MYHLLMPSLYTLTRTYFVIVLKNIIFLKKREKPYLSIRNLQILLEYIKYILTNNISLYFILFFTFFQLVNYLKFIDNLCFYFHTFINFCNKKSPSFLRLFSLFCILKCISYRIYYSLRAVCCSAYSIHL